MKRKKRKNGEVLLILDFLNDFDFPEAEQLIRPALKAAKATVKLKNKLKKRGVPVIYLNDNFGRWHADWRSVFEYVTEEGRPGREIAMMLEPQGDDYFILKPKHSGFYLTALEVLLEDLGAETLIMTGIAGNLCVLFTANDAHMRNYDVIVPRDCVASNTKADNEHTLRQIKTVLGLSTSPSVRL